MTDPGMADRTYVGPMTPELAEQILAKVRCPSANGVAARQRWLLVHLAGS
jgi:carbamoylphosphate synthase large subunit